MKTIITTLLALFVSLSLFSCKGSKSAAGKKHRYMNKVYNDMKRELKDADVSIANDSVKVIFPENVMFDFGATESRPEARPAIERFASMLKRYNKTHVLISGHTDNVGTEVANKNLSTDRAEGIKRLLTSLDINDRRMETWGMGERDPIAPNDTEANRARNRRVEFVMLHDYTADEK